jgi:hypothetical protein
VDGRRAAARVSGTGKLIIRDSEAETLRFIFRRYAELDSVRLLKDELDARRIHSKLRTSASGRVRGSKPFARGALYLMLQNRVYRGEIVHKEQSHPGEHTPIIDQPLWEAVQAPLASNAAERNYYSPEAGKAVSYRRAICPYTAVSGSNGGRARGSARSIVPNVLKQDRLAGAVVRGLGERAWARNGAAAIVEPVSRDVPAGNLGQDLRSWIAASEAIPDDRCLIQIKSGHSAVAPCAS